MKPVKVNFVRLALIIMVMVGGTFVKDVFKIGVKDGLQQKAKIASHKN